MTELPFFAAKVRLGRGGAEEIFPLGPLNEFERLVYLIVPIKIPYRSFHTVYEYYLQE